MDKKVTTTNITYRYDDATDKMIGKTICETVSTPPELAYDGECEVETGVELDGVVGTSPLEVLLMATIGTLLGNVLYRAIRKN